MTHSDCLDNLSATLFSMSKATSVNNNENKDANKLCTRGSQTWIGAQYDNADPVGPLGHLGNAAWHITDRTLAVTEIHCSACKFMQL